jgi:hypothetical protein
MSQNDNNSNSGILEVNVFGHYWRCFMLELLLFSLSQTLRLRPNSYFQNKMESTITNDSTMLLIELMK